MVKARSMFVLMLLPLVLTAAYLVWDGYLSGLAF